MGNAYLWNMDPSELFSGPYLAAMILGVVVMLIIMALCLLIAYLIIRSAVRSGIDRSDLARFIRQAKLLELRDKGLVPDEEQPGKR